MDTAVAERIGLRPTMEDATVVESPLRRPADLPAAERGWLRRASERLAAKIRPLASAAAPTESLAAAVSALDVLDALAADAPPAGEPVLQFEPVELEPDVHLFGVFDGHGGAICSAFVADLFAGYVAEAVAARRPRAPGDAVELGGALVEAFERVERAWAALARRVKEEANIPVRDGSCAVAVAVAGATVVCANAGDSRAVLCRGGVAVPLSRDHKPDEPDERGRVEAAGGAVDYHAYVPAPPSWLCCCVPPARQGLLPFRVFPGGIAISRALGDVHLKDPGYGVVEAPLVSGSPELRVARLQPVDEFLLLACDGVWDVLTNQQAVALVRGQLARGASLQRASDALADMALRAGSTDNVTVVVVSLRGSGSGSGGGSGGGPEAEGEAEVEAEDEDERASLLADGPPSEAEVELTVVV